MKKILLFAALAIAGMNQLKAQEYDGKAPHLGVRISDGVISLANSALGSQTTNQFLLGFSGGVFYEMPVSGRFYMMPELNYTFKGGSSTADISGGMTSNYNSTAIYIRQDLRYLTVPVLFELRTASRWVGFYAGPEFGYLLSARQTYTDTSNHTTDLRPFLRKMDVALDFGVNFRLYEGFGMDIRYSYGLENILESSKTADNQTTGSATPNQKIKTRSFGLGVFYKF